MLRIWFVLIAISLVSMAANAAPELRGNPQELEQYLQSGTRTVSIRKTATETAYTDRARISLVVTTRDRLLAEAIRMNQEKRRSTIRDFVDGGISIDEIRSSKFSTSPQFGWFGSKPNSFEVVNTIIVTVESEKQFQLVAAMADQHKEISFSRTEFEHSLKEEFEKKVRQQAMDHVMEERGFYESRLDLVLKPVAFSTSEIRPERMRRQPVLEQMVLTARSTEADAGQIADVAGFDEVKYMASVVVVFEVTTR